MINPKYKIGPDDWGFENSHKAQFIIISSSFVDLQTFTCLTLFIFLFCELEQKHYHKHKCSCLMPYFHVTEGGFLEPQIRKWPQLYCIVSTNEMTQYSTAKTTSLLNFHGWIRVIPFQNSYFIKSYLQLWPKICIFQLRLQVFDFLFTSSLAHELKVLTSLQQS